MTIQQILSGAILLVFIIIAIVELYVLREKDTSSGSYTYVVRKGEGDPNEAFLNYTGTDSVSVSIEDFRESIKDYDPLLYESLDSTTYSSILLVKLW